MVGPKKEFPRQNRRPPHEGHEKSPDTERLGKFLSFVLRHHPEEIGIGLDVEGQVEIDILVIALHRKSGFEKIVRRDIERLAAGPSGSRFEIRGGRIRARYGHSLPQAIRYEPATPPANLFHGTTPDAAEAILADGLKAHGRQRVHLSVDIRAAKEVGRRRCENPVILRIDTAAAAKAGVKFYCGGPAVWLADDIPPKCIAKMP
jgi:putative RNA 2'-phosphotransferase